MTTSAKEKQAGEDKSRQRLGRGLASLIGGGASLRPAGAPGQGGSGERSVPVGQLRANPKNPRRRFDEADLAELSASIKAHGVVQPILVRPVEGEVARFEIVAGERRWRAAQLAALQDVPVVVRALTDRETLEIAIIENVQRADLDAIEEAQAYGMLIDEHGYTQGDLADVLGKSRSHVTNTLRLLKLPDPVQRMVSAGELSPGHARVAVSVKNPEGFAKSVAERGLTVREAEGLARRETDASERGPARKPAAKPPKLKEPAAAQGEAAKRPDVSFVEAALSDELGYTVRLEPAGEGGSLRIDYDTPERRRELVRLLQLAAGHRRDPRIRQL